MRHQRSIQQKKGNFVALEIARILSRVCTKKYLDKKKGEEMMEKFKKVVNRDNYYSRQMKDFFWRLACCCFFIIYLPLRSFLSIFSINPVFLCTFKGGQGHYTQLSKVFFILFPPIRNRLILDEAGPRRGIYIQSSILYQILLSRKTVFSPPTRKSPPFSFLREVDSKISCWR